MRKKSKKVTKKVVKKTMKRIMKKVMKNAPKPDLTQIFDFNCCGTKMSLLENYYTRSLRGKTRTKGLVVIMNPKDFLKVHGTPKLPDTVMTKIKNLIADPKQRFPLPYLDIRQRQFMGRARAIYFMKEGLDFPIFICGNTVEDVKKWLKGKKIAYKAYE